MANSDAGLERLLTPAEVSKLLQVHDQTLRNWRNNGAGPQWIRVGAQIRYRRHDLERWLAERKRP